MPLQFSPPITTARVGLVARIAASAGASVASRLALVSLSCGSLLISNHSLASGLAAKRAATCFHTAASQGAVAAGRSEEQTSELQSLMRLSYSVFCLKNKKQRTYLGHNEI